MQIRLIIDQDKEQIYEMRQDLWPHCSLEEHILETELYFDPKKEITALVAVLDDGNLCGFLEIGTRDVAEDCETTPVAYIEGWYVKENYRQQGIGKRLVQAAEAWAREKGLKEIASDALIDNELSLKAHLALGYQEVDRLVHFKKLL